MRFARALALVVLCAPWSALAADPLETCETRAALQQKRLGELQLRLARLEHELATRPPATASQQAWRDAAAWQRLRLGMSQADVLKILGAPGRVSGASGFIRWEYPDALGQRVNFDERGALISWGALAR